MVIRRSLCEIERDSALRKVVLPLPVPPEMTMDRRARTASLRMQRHGRGECADGDEAFHVVGVADELADGDERPVDGDRADRHVDARAVEQAGIDHGLGFVDAAAHGGDDFIGDAQHVRLVLEAHGHRFELAEPLHVNVLVRVDEDVGDGGVLEEGLDGAEARELVHHLVDEGVELQRVERQALAEHVIGNHVVDLLAQLGRRYLVDQGQVELVDELAMQADLGIDQLRLL